MVGKAICKFGGDESGAIAPLYALSLFGLVAMAGVGFDYARVMALDSELQNAADQAALAAASQLDGREDSVQRAIQATRATFATSSSAFVNETRLSNIDDDNDGNTRPITQLGFAFWQSYSGDAPTGSVPASETPSDAAAKANVVQVTINNRQVRYALTPIVGAIVGTAAASAMATMDSAYCDVPPLMFCLPPGTFDSDGDGDGDVDINFPGPFDTGKSMRLHLTPSDSNESTSPFSPGNFGFLDFPYPISGNPNTTLAGSGNNPNCTGENVDTRTGVRNPEAGALNTRFDLDPDSCSDEAHCPSQNTTKDYVYEESYSGLDDPSEAFCGGDADNKGGWVKYSELDQSDFDTPYTGSAPGYQEDTCFSSSCTDYPVGDGDWPYAAYMMGYYGSVPTTGGPTNSRAGFPSGYPSTPTRYDVYKWEIDQGASALQNREIGRTVTSKTAGNSGKVTYDVDLVCEYRTPREEDPFIPDTALKQKDRRVLTVAAVDCTGLNGKDVANIIRYVDLFLVKPANEGGSDKAFFTEIIGESREAGSNTSFQTFAKRKAVLIR